MGGSATLSLHTPIEWPGTGDSVLGGGTSNAFHGGSSSGSGGGGGGSGGSTLYYDAIKLTVTAVSGGKVIHATPVWCNRRAKQSLPLSQGGGGGGAVGGGAVGGGGSSPAVKKSLNPFATAQTLPIPPPTRASTPTLPTPPLRPPSPSLPSSHPPTQPTIQNTNTNQAHNQPANKDRNFTLKLSLKSIGLSVIAERPVRREFLSLYIDGIDATMCQRTINNPSHMVDGNGLTSASAPGLGLGPASGSGLSSGSALTSYQLEIADIQIDNYSETAIRPVLLHSFSSSRRELKKAARRRQRAMRKGGSTHGSSSGSGSSSGGGEGSMDRDLLDLDLPSGTSGATGQTPSSQHVGSADDFPFFSISVVQELPRGSSTPIFKYVAVRMLEAKLALDSATLQVTDSYSPVSIIDNTYPRILTN